MWRAVPEHLKQTVASHLRRTPRFQSFQPNLRPDDAYVRLALAVRRNELLVAHSSRMEIYDVTESGCLLGHWNMDLSNPISSVRLDLDEVSGRVVVYDGDTVIMYALNGIELARRTIIPWLGTPTFYDFRRDELYVCHRAYVEGRTYHRAYVEVETFLGRKIRKYSGAAWQTIGHLQVLDNGMLLVVRRDGLFVCRPTDGLPLHVWGCESVWDLGVHDNTVYVVSNGAMKMFRLSDGGYVGSWRSRININAMAVARNGRIFVSDGYRIYVPQ